MKPSTKIRSPGAARRCLYFSEVLLVPQLRIDTIMRPGRSGRSRCCFGREEERSASAEQTDLILVAPVYPGEDREKGAP